MFLIKILTANISLKDIICLQTLKRITKVFLHFFLIGQISSIWQIQLCITMATSQIKGDTEVACVDDRTVDKGPWFKPPPPRNVLALANIFSTIDKLVEGQLPIFQCEQVNYFEEVRGRSAAGARSLNTFGLVWGFPCRFGVAMGDGKFPK